MLIITAILIGIVLIVVFTSILKYNTFLSIFAVSLIIALITLPLQDVVPTILTGFGNTMKSIGLIIIFGIILGLILDKTYATKSIAHAILKLTGKKNAAWPSTQQVLLQAFLFSAIRVLLYSRELTNRWSKVRVNQWYWLQCLPRVCIPSTA